MASRSRGILRKSQREEFLRLAVHQDPRGLLIYFDQIGSESVRAINVLYQAGKFIVSNRFLILLQHAPFRFAAENADVVRRMQGQRKNRQAKRENGQLPLHFFEMKHRRLNPL